MDAGAEMGPKEAKQGGWRLTLDEIAQIEEGTYSPEFLRMALLLGEDNCKRAYLAHFERLRDAASPAEAAMAARKGAQASAEALARAEANPAQTEWLKIKALGVERRRAEEGARRAAAGLPCRYDRRGGEWVYPGRWAPVPHVDAA